MKKETGVITYYYDMNGRPERMKDIVIKKCLDTKIIKPLDYWGIEKDGSNEPCGAFVHVEGNKLIIKFLSWLTNSHSSKGTVVELRANDTGKFISAKELRP